ncbi:MAG: hypothetical protein ACRDP7_07500 [Trebonia sp.]
MLVPVAVAGLAGCGNGSSSAGASSTATSSANGALTAATLREALLTRVNGVAAAAPASSGTYSSMQAANSKAVSGVQVTPKACAAAATEGFNSATLGAAPSAAVTFRVGTNGVSEVLIASSAQSAATVLAAHVPTECAQYQETVAGKTYTYDLKEKVISGIGNQARVLNMYAASAKSDEMWSLVYQAKGFIGTVTVVGPNATEAAVTELGQQAYAFATKSLS